jgi:branched-subunit amino acid aminotransferase/4-amino-4-deoxychorismate lyase
LKITKNSFKIKEADILLKSIKSYDEIFISSTLLNIMPVRQIDDIIFKTNFGKTHLIQKLFKNYCDKKIFKK